MSVDISFFNVDKLVFYDKEVQKQLPEFSETFKKWLIGFRISNDTIMKSARLDFLSKIEDQHIEKLKVYFKTDVIVEKTDTNLVKNYIVDIDCVPELSGNFSMSREGNSLYIVTWR